MTRDWDNLDLRLLARVQRLERAVLFLAESRHVPRFPGELYDELREIVEADEARRKRETQED